MLHLLEEDAEASRAWITEGYQLVKDQNHAIALHTLLKIDGMNHLYTGMVDEALVAFESALRFLNEQGVPHQAADVMAFYSEALARTGNHEAAIETLEQATALAGQHSAQHSSFACVQERSFMANNIIKQEHNLL